MNNKFPEIYKKKIDKLKSKIQNTYYYTHKEVTQNKKEAEEINEYDLKSKINAIFKKPNFVYQADVNIMYKNGDNITTSIIGFKNNKLITKDGNKIDIEDIKDIN